jgi:hypothetical protein
MYATGWVFGVCFTGRIVSHQVLMRFRAVPAERMKTLIL